MRTVADEIRDRAALLPIDRLEIVDNPPLFSERNGLTRTVDDLPADLLVGEPVRFTADGRVERLRDRYMAVPGGEQLAELTHNAYNRPPRGGYYTQEQMDALVGSAMVPQPRLTDPAVPDNRVYMVDPE